MEKWKNDLQKLCNHKIYILMLCLTAGGGYGFKITHPALGIDDTPYALYFEKGLAAIVGRWVLFLLNKVAAVSDFAPWLTDFAAVLLLMTAVMVWALLFFSVLRERVPAYGYWFFSCIFLSCPLISEVFTYYLHNGIAIGYLCSGVSLCLFREGMLRLDGGQKDRIKKAVPPFVTSLVFLVVALGCYESFMIVWLTGVLLLFLTERLAGEKTAVWKRLFLAAGTAVGGMILRSVVIRVVVGIFGLDDLRSVAEQRSIGEMLGWMFEPGASAEFAMVLKRLFVMYGVFGYAYYPIRIFVFASFVIVLVGIWRAVRQKDVWIVLLMVGAFTAAFLLAVIEGKATLYRSAQFLPLICGYGFLMLSILLNGSERRENRKGKKNRPLREKFAVGCRVLYVLIAAVILWNQCEDLNGWFYVDYRKYEYAKELTAQIAHDLEKDFDISKPVMFTGEWENPKILIADAYVDYNSETFFKMKRITDLVDEHLLEKFYRGYGVWVAQTPSLSVINWGRYAFGTDEELVRFFAFHGHELVPFLEPERYAEAEEYSLDLPVFPQQGSIVDRGDYIIVHL